MVDTKPRIGQNYILYDLVEFFEQLHISMNWSKVIKPNKKSKFKKTVFSEIVEIFMSFCPSSVFIAYVFFVCLSVWKSVHLSISLFYNYCKKTISNIHSKIIILFLKILSFHLFTDLNKFDFFMEFGKFRLFYICS